MKVRHWTNNELIKLRNFYSQARATGLSLKRIAKLLKRSEDAISIKASRLGIAFPVGKAPLTEEHHINRSKGQKAYHANHPEAGEIIAKRVRKWHKTHEHPRGYLGKKHSPKALAKMGAASKRMWANPDHKVNSDEYRQRLSDRVTAMRERLRHTHATFSKGKAGVRKDVGPMRFRSKWEANYARVLMLKQKRGEIDDWQYEPTVFHFPIKRGVRTFTPDFSVIVDGHLEYHEIRGYGLPARELAITYFRKYYPLVKLIIIREPEYESIEKQFKSTIPHWEHRKEPHGTTQGNAGSPA